jgi:hypothetical protein
MMAQHPGDNSIERLAPYIGEWQMQAVFPGSSQTQAAAAQSAARTVFEWLAGRQFVLQRWEVPDPAAPDGIAIIGSGRGRGTYRQHYFDSRGVARLYEMSFADGLWTLSRTTSDFSPLDFSQRYTATFSDDGRTIDGSWESSSDGLRWEHDFQLVYTRMS